MNDNYLWDRTGEPDAEVQQLEDLLGTLRYQPRALEIPATNFRRRRTFIPLTIAAAIALLVIGAALWIRFAAANRQSVEQVGNRPQPVAPLEPAPTPQEQTAESLPSQKPNEISQDRRNARQNVALKPRRSIQPPVPALTEAELAQKEQVLVALRLVSAKLNLAQRKAQGLPPVNAFRNRKIG